MIGCSGCLDGKMVVEVSRVQCASSRNAGQSSCLAQTYETIPLGIERGQSR